ncbi:serine hydrolase domain-containing protein [Paenibacillus paridis]|uniref:serine hydrolase domain-containing protein n=1 Tax=Paenibacillus paridis TaxID=2583376 RepID=UPI001122A9E8|nr:serine hydrolase domain-containing protein [Paenibacillus paridis]
MSGQSIFRNALCMSVLLYTIAAALTSYGVTPERAYAAQEGGESAYAELDSYMETAMEALDIPGAALGIVQKDAPLYIKGYGTADSKNTAITPQTPFILGSTSKSFTAMAVMQLVEAGKVGLDAPVQQYLPSFRVADEQASSEITVRQLLNQTSGISAFAGKDLPSHELTLAQYPAAKQEAKLSGPAGSQFEYSNMNYDVLGALVQKVSGQSYGEYVKRQIFEPLGMGQTTTSYSESLKLGLSEGHQPIFGWLFATSPKERAANVPSGYIQSSAEDMSHYLVAQLNNGVYEGKQLVSGESVALMHGEQGARMEEGGLYGMGWMSQNGAVYHQGSVENFQSNLFIEGETGIVLLLNANDPLVSAAEMMTEGIRQILAGEKPSPADLPSMGIVHWVMRAAAVAIVLFIIRSIYVSAAWNKIYRPNRPFIARHAISIMLFHLLIPLAVLFALPLWMDAPWKLLLAFMPGMTHLLYMASIVLLAYGMVRLILLFKSMSMSRP